MNMNTRVVVLTGATGGLGRVVARRFAEMGASLALLSRNSAELDQLRQSLALPDRRLTLHTVDLMDGASTQETAQAILAKYTHIDVLCHLVGGWTGGVPVLQLPAEDVESMLHQHVWTTFHALQAFVPPMLANGWGRVIAISTPFAQRPRANGSAYSLAKAAQEALLLSLAEEIVGSGVTANLIAVRAIDVKGERLREPSKKNAAWATPDEIASVIEYLCSDEARMLNGARIPVQGSPL
jgi:NAD(P)-dependent dehydrogenase (short-subunit alcohol dehydrogenase family)